MESDMGKRPTDRQTGRPIGNQAGKKTFTGVQNCTQTSRHMETRRSGVQFSYVQPQEDSFSLRENRVDGEKNREEKKKEKKRKKD